MQIKDIPMRLGCFLKLEKAKISVHHISTTRTRNQVLLGRGGQKRWFSDLSLPYA